MTDYYDRSRFASAGWDSSNADIRADIARAMYDVEHYNAGEPNTMIVSPIVLERIHAQLAYMETRRYKAKRYVRLRLARVRYWILRRYCPHPYARVYVDSDGTYCTLCKQIDIDD